MKFFHNLTFLLPVYNGGEDFKRLLKSLDDLNDQTNIIIYSDGSIDDSYRIACAFGELSKHKVCVIDGRKNRGYFRTIKILLKICSTDFFMFLGHDDQLSKDFLEEFDVITSGRQDIACIYTDIASITPAGEIIDTWPHFLRKEDAPDAMQGCEILNTFHKHHWGSLFVAIWSKRVLNHATLFEIMGSVPSSALVEPLKKIGFLNDNMAVLRAVSHNTTKVIFFKKIGKYFKRVDLGRLSEGRVHFNKEDFLHSPIGYLSIVAHFMLPQIKQKNIATFWALRYLYIYFGIATKALFRNFRFFDANVFLRGIGLILTGYAASMTAGRSDRKAN